MVKPEFWSEFELKFQNYRRVLCDLLNAMVEKKNVKVLDEKTIQCMSAWILNRQDTLSSEHRFGEESTEYM